MFIGSRLVGLSYPDTIILNTFLKYSVAETLIRRHVDMRVRYTEAIPAILLPP